MTGRHRRFAGDECGILRDVPHPDHVANTRHGRFVAHCHMERHHQGLDNELIMRETCPLRGTRVHCRERLGGVLWYYHRAA
jgi:hypothetical protein